MSPVTDHASGECRSLTDGGNDKWVTIEADGALMVRRHGDRGPCVIVLHGGPAAYGSACALAQGIAGSFSVFEPWQRKSGGEPLTVERHLRDLNAVADTVSPEGSFALVGESWGAMLALAYAARYPGRAAALALIGCGTFDEISRACMTSTIEARMDDGVRDRLSLLTDESCDSASDLVARYRLILPLFHKDPVEPPALPGESFDLRGHRESMEDMLRLERDGVHPAAFSAVDAPVLMLHGDYDPHPGKMIYESLSRHIPRIEYHELKNCGHSPWNERAAHDEFYTILSAWLFECLSAG